MALRTTFLTGFPGETDKAAQNTQVFLKKIKPMWSTRINLNVGDIIVSLDKNKSTNKFSIKNIMMYDGMQDSTPTFAYVENDNSSKSS